MAQRASGVMRPSVMVMFCLPIFTSSCAWVVNGANRANRANRANEFFFIIVVMFFFLFLPYRVASQSTAQLLENLSINLAQHDGGVYLTVTQQRQFLQSPATAFVAL